MTDAEIIKALECCTIPHTEVKCYCCKSANGDICSKLNPTIILDLIRRQQAEIEKLKKLQQRQADLIIEERGRRYELASQFTTSKAETDKTEDEILKRLLTRRVEFIPNNKDIEDIQMDAVINFANKLMCNLDGDIEAYANAGHDLDVYGWLKSYLVSRGAIKAELEMFPKQKGEENG